MEAFEARTLLSAAYALTTVATINTTLQPKLVMDAAGDLFGVGASDRYAAHTLYELPHDGSAAQIVGSFADVDSYTPVGGIAVTPAGDVFGIASDAALQIARYVLYERPAGGTSLIAVAQLKNGSPLSGTTCDGAGNVYWIAPGTTSPIPEIDELVAGTTTPIKIAGLPNLGYAGQFNITADAQGDLYGMLNSSLTEFNTNYVFTLPAGTRTLLAVPSPAPDYGDETLVHALAIDPAGNLFRSSQNQNGDDEIIKMDPAGVESTFGALPKVRSDGYIQTLQSSNYAFGTAVDSAGNLFAAVDDPSPSYGHIVEFPFGSTNPITIASLDTLPAQQVQGDLTAGPDGSVYAVSYTFTTAADGVSTIITSNVLRLTPSEAPAPVARLSVTSPPASVANDQPLSSAIAVSAIGSDGQTLASDNGQIVTVNAEPYLWVKIQVGDNLNEASKTSAVDAQITGATSAALIGGQANFGGLSFVENAGLAFVLTASGATFESGSSSPFVISHEATHLAIVTGTQPSFPGVTSSAPLTVDVLDVNNNPVAGDAQPTVTVTVVNGFGAIAGTVSKQTVNGVATFTDVSVSLPSDYTFGAIADDGLPAASANVTVAKINTSIDLLSGATEAVVTNDVLTLIAKVTADASAPASAIPIGGVVEFKDFQTATDFGTAVVGADGLAVLPLVSIDQKVRTIEAFYDGDFRFTTSTSATLPVTRQTIAAIGNGGVTIARSTIKPIVALGSVGHGSVTVAVDSALALQAGKATVEIQARPTDPAAPSVVIGKRVATLRGKSLNLAVPVVLPASLAADGYQIFATVIDAAGTAVDGIASNPFGVKLFAPALSVGLVFEGGNGAVEGVQLNLTNIGTGPLRGPISLTGVDDLGEIAFRVRRSVNIAAGKLRFIRGGFSLRGLSTGKRQFVLDAVFGKTEAISDPQNLTLL